MYSVRSYLPALFLAALLAADLAAADPFQASAQADRTSVQLGQPVLITVRVRGCQETPDVEPPTVPGATISRVGEAQVLSTVFADLEKQGLLHPNGGRVLAQAFKGLGPLSRLADIEAQLQKLASVPSLSSSPADPDLLQAYQQALKNLSAFNPQAFQRVQALGQNDHVFTFKVQPKRSGEIVVPAFTIRSQGLTTTTAQLSLQVKDIQPQPWVRLALSLANPRPTAGEEVDLFVDVLVQRASVSYGSKTYPHLPVSELSLTLPVLERTGPCEPARPLEKIVQANLVPPGSRGVRINTIPGEMKLDQEPRDAGGLDPNRCRRRVTLPLRMTAGGSVMIPAAHAAGKVYVPSGPGRGKWEPFVAASEPLSFAVLDLQGRTDRPVEFGGAVGPVRVSSSASQTQLAVGTPFTLTVRVEGTTSVARATAPDLAGRPDFCRSFRVHLDNEHQLTSTSREFTYTLRPLNEDVTEVPAVSVSYFDPKRNSFATVRSQSIPLQVSPAKNVTPETPSPPVPVDTSIPPTPTMMWYPSTDTLLLWAEVALGSVCAVCVLLWSLRRWRYRRAIQGHKHQVQRSIAEAKRRLQEGEPSFQVVRQVLQDFLRREFPLKTGEITPLDALECLRRAGLEEGLARAFAELLENCATGEFAPGLPSVAVSGVAASADRLLERLGASIPVLAAARCGVRVGKIPSTREAKAPSPSPACSEVGAERSTCRRAGQ
jgi:hypothetical protein